GARRRSRGRECRHAAAAAGFLPAPPARHRASEPQRGSLSMAWRKLLALGAALAPLAEGAIGPRQPVGEILNPSAEIVNAEGLPAAWTAEPARATAGSGTRSTCESAHAGRCSLEL